MAISRMNMERQMRNMGGIMGLEDQRQGYFLGKLVKKITKPIKKVVKSPLGKVALGAAALKFGGPSIAKLLGKDATGFLSGRFLGDKGIFSAARGLFDKGRFLSPLVRDAEGNFSLGRAALTGLGATAIAAPFFMGDDEEVDEGVDFAGVQPMVADIRRQARRYYTEPASRADLGLYFMPQEQFVQKSFLAADGGLADIPRGGYDNGGKVCFPADNPAVKDLMSNMKPRAFAANGGIMMASNTENDKILESLFEKYLDMGMSPLDAEKAARDEFEKMTKRLNADRATAAEGGLMDLGGMEKDYREGGFVPIGAKERADDVPARLSKNEFVFTADAVRNAGGGDIDKGAEVMQNMMDNLEAGGTISEESQGMENPAQAMFDQSQMLEGRLA